MTMITNAEVSLAGDIVTIDLTEGGRLVGRVGLTECEASAMTTLEVGGEWKDNSIYMMKFDEGVWVEQGSLALEIPEDVLDETCDRIKKLLKEASKG